MQSSDEWVAQFQQYEHENMNIPAGDASGGNNNTDNNTGDRESMLMVSSNNHTYYGNSCGDNELRSPKGEANIGKPIRRRSRASKRTPTTLLNASTTNFRALVQQFTGCQSPPTSSNLGAFYKGPINLNFGRNDDSLDDALSTLGYNNNNYYSGRRIHQSEKPRPVQRGRPQILQDYGQQNPAHVQQQNQQSLGSSSRSDINEQQQLQIGASTATTTATSNYSSSTAARINEENEEAALTIDDFDMDSVSLGEDYYYYYNSLDEASAANNNNRTNNNIQGDDEDSFFVY